MEKKKNSATVALKKLVKTYPRINIRGHRDPKAPSWSDPFIFEVEGSNETHKPMRERGMVQLSGQVHGGCDDTTETITPGSGLGAPYEKYSEGFRPTEGFWYLASHEDILRAVVLMLPDDAEVEVEVYLDAGTHCNLVKHRLHADYLYLTAKWQRGTRRYERRFMIDSMVSYHNSNRFGGPNTLAR